MRIVIRACDISIDIHVLNDTPKEACFEMEYGYISFYGEKKDTKSIEVKSSPFSREKIKTVMKTDANDMRAGVFYAKAIEFENILPATLRSGNICDPGINAPDMHLSGYDPSEGAFDICSDIYAHGVHFGLDDDIRLSDEYFDLLPGEKRRIWIQNKKEKIAAGDIKPKSVMI